MGELVGPMRMRYILVIVDAFSKFVILAPTPDVKMNTVADVYAYFGWPKEFVFDNATSFTGQIVVDMCRWLEVQRSPSIARAPHTNGQAERYVGIAKHMIVRIAHGAPDRWLDAPNDQLGGEKPRDLIGTPKEPVLQNLHAVTRYARMSSSHLRRGWQ